MIAPGLYSAFIVATLILCIIPGPVVTYLVATGIAQGPRAAMTGLAGSTSALVLHMIFVVAGLAPLLAALGHSADILKFIGALYLVYLGIQAWRAPVSTDDNALIQPAKRTARSLYTRGLLISLTNPKTLIFYAAFFPQFIDATKPVLPQTILLAVTFVLLGALSDGAYGLAAGHLAPFIKSPRAQKIRNRITGTVLTLTGIGLALARR
ncbi:MAG: LysE family translocator [Parvibaculaceae bacterium]